MANGLTPAIYKRNKILRKARQTDAEREYAALLEKNPNHFDALHRLGFLHYEQGRYTEALKLIKKALTIRPEAADALSHYGMALRKLNRHQEALAFYERALKVKPDYADALNNRGNVLLDLSRYEEALPNFDKALAIRLRFPQALNNRGNALMQLHRYEEALESYEQALAFHPDYYHALKSRANALLELRRFQDALDAYESVLQIEPRDPDLMFNTGRAFKELGKNDQALMAYDRTLELNPRHTNGLYHRGHLLSSMNRVGDAIADFRRLLSLEPENPNALTSLLGCHANICNWHQIARLARDLEKSLDQGKFVFQPFQLISLPSTPAQQLKCAQNYVRAATRGMETPSWKPLAPDPAWGLVPRANDKIRLGYYSADFKTHVVATVITELFELHDRSRFELVGISFGFNDNSPMRQRIIAAFDQFHDVRLRSDLEIANLMHDLGIDIAIDLTGHTGDTRTQALAYRPCPIQVNYLGYPGTTGAPFIDYILVDETVVPLDQQPFFTEKLVHLPDSYLPNDSRHLKMFPNVPTRKEVGLPEQGFVFCGFTQSYKISGPLFEVWMRLLRSVDGSVLWLAKMNDTSIANLKREAAARGVDPERLIVAPRADPTAYHLARHRQADLFLDTVPYNAHTTAANALWAGLPVLTCKGVAFPGRVGASLLRALGLPELVANNLEEYEALALKLATEPDLLQSLRSRLWVNRLEYPLFDQDRLCRHLEAAYETMWDNHQRGEAPKSFRVEPISPAGIVEQSDEDVDVRDAPPGS